MIFWFDQEFSLFKMTNIFHTFSGHTDISEIFFHAIVSPVAIALDLTVIKNLNYQHISKSQCDNGVSKASLLR